MLGEMNYVEFAADLEQLDIDELNAWDVEEVEIEGDK